MSRRPAGMAYNRQGAGTGFGSREQRIEEGNATLLERENDAKWAELGDQVSLLKTLSQEINQEVDSQNALLSGMGGQFGSVGTMFSDTLGKMGDMLSQGSSFHMYYLVAFVVFIFFALYILMGRK